MPAPDIPPGLPAPSVEESAFGAAASTLIREEIAHQGGAVPFSRFMELALYQPRFGYYTGRTEKFGAGGDFVTAPEAYPLFGRCLAHAIAPLIRAIPGAGVLEVGAGTGKLAATLLTELAAIDAMPSSYQILDLSPDLRRRQDETIAQLARAAHARVRWLDSLPARGFRGVVLANELLDAMPVERFRVEENAVRQLHVGWERDRFIWVDGPPNAEIARRIAPLRLRPGYTSEVGFAAEAWVRSVADILDTAVLLLIDYGFPRAEFYHPDRSSGTLMCHYRHRAHGDPLALVGLQDITAHIDFTAIAEAGVEGGLDLLGYTSQAAFLLGAGMDQLIAASDPADVRRHLELTAQVKKLTLPHEMGELYKVIALGRNVDTELRAFSLQDRRSRL